MAGTEGSSEREGGEGHHPALRVCLEGHTPAPPPPPAVVVVGLGTRAELRLVEEQVRLEHRIWTAVVFHLRKSTK